MKVILNVDAITAPLTGIGRYALALAHGLAHHPAIENIRYYAAYRWVANPESALAANQVISSVRRHVPFKTQALSAYQHLRSQAFRLRTRDCRDALLHTPNYILLPHQGPSVTTVHDLSWLHYPDFHPIERVRFMNQTLPKSLAQAHHIIVDAPCIKNELIHVFSVDAARISVVPLGVDASFYPRPDKDGHAVCARYGLREHQFLLSVATREPRKNVARLLDAYAALPSALKRAYPLVLAGAHGWQSSHFATQLAHMVRRGEVHVLGYVPENDLPQLYASAHAFAFPSLYEGFGLPVLEAMKSGVPCLTSTNTAMADISHGAAWLINPHDTDELRRGLQKILLDEPWRQHARAHGLDLAAQYTWSACVDGTVKAYERALAWHQTTPSRSA